MRGLAGLAAALALLVVVARPPVCDARQVKRLFRSHDRLAVLESFCFAPANNNNQRPNLTIGGTSVHGNQHVVAFDNTAWREAQRTRHTTGGECRHLLDRASLRIDALDQGWKEASLGTGLVVSKPTFWFVVAVCCGEGCDRTGLDLQYEARMFNPPFSSFPSLHFNREFSADQAGLAVVYGVFAGLFAILTAGHVFGTLVFPTAKTRAHHVPKLVGVALVVQFGVVFAKLLHFNLLGTTGMGSSSLDSLADVGGAIFECVVIAIAAMVVSGWAFGELPRSRSSCVCGAMAVLAVCVAFVACYAAMMACVTVADPQCFVYATPFGVLVLCLRLLFAVAIPLGMLRRLPTCNVESRRLAYKVVAGVVSGWLLCLTGVAVVGSALAAEDRPRVFALVTLTANLLVLQALVWLGWPTVASAVLNMYAPQDDEMGFGRANDGL